MLKPRRKPYLVRIWRVVEREQDKQLERENVSSKVSESTKCDKLSFLFSVCFVVEESRKSRWNGESTSKSGVLSWVHN